MPSAILLVANIALLGVTLFFTVTTRDFSLLDRNLHSALLNASLAATLSIIVITASK